jgi:hypothetical protein
VKYFFFIQTAYYHLLRSCLYQAIAIQKEALAISAKEFYVLFKSQPSIPHTNQNKPHLY